MNEPLNSYSNTFHFRDEEHALIAQYSQMLNGEDTEGVIPSSAQIMAIIEMEQERELQNIIEELEEENR